MPDVARTSRRYTPTGEEANLKYYEMFAGLQISGLKFQSLKSISRELELSNFLGLVLGCTSSGARPQARASGGTCPHSDNHAKGEVGPAHKHYAAIVCWQ